MAFVKIGKTYQNTTTGVRWKKTGIVGVNTWTEDGGTTKLATSIDTGLITPAQKQKIDSLRVPSAKIITSAQTLPSGNYLVNSAGGAFTVTLADETGGAWNFYDYSNTLSTNNVTIAVPSGKSVTDQAKNIVLNGTLALDVDNEILQIVRPESSDVYFIGNENTVVVPPVFTPNGSYNAATNTPDATLAANQESGSSNYVYAVSVAGVAGTTTPSLAALGIADGTAFAVGDQLFWYGTTWFLDKAGSQATSVPLTRGRVLALLDLTSTTHINSDPGTKIPFTGTVYTSGMTANAGSLTPSVSGRYRADWLCMATSTDFLADGIFHVVQNGVSVGQVSYNMNEASAVNQSAGFIDVDLVAGQAVSLHYRTRHTASDGIAWDRGSYFQLTQIPTDVIPVVTNGGTWATYVPAFQDQGAGAKANSTYDLASYAINGKTITLNYRWQSAGTAGGNGGTGAGRWSLPPGIQFDLTKIKADGLTGGVGQLTGSVIGSGYLVYGATSTSGPVIVYPFDANSFGFGLNLVNTNLHRMGGVTDYSASGLGAAATNGLSFSITAPIL